MKIGRKQTIGNIQFFVESNFKNGDAKSAKERLLEIMIRKASEALRYLNQAKAAEAQK
ncbi:MAG: hypothetical protein IJQ80_04560 [Clostridia bacterium]|nr:hypothetical protein [Clostridia bacterium]